MPPPRALLVASCTLALASCASSGREDALPEIEGRARPLSEVLQGCAVEPDGRRMRCDGVVVDVSEGPQETSFEERARARASDLLAEAVIDRVSLDVLGRKEVVERARIAAVYGDTHLLTLFFARAGGSSGRGFTCEAPADVEEGDRRCAELLASYLAEAPRQKPEAKERDGAPPPGLDVAGRTLPLVGGCKAEAAPPGGRLACPFAAVAWRPFSSMEEAVAAALEATAPYQAVANARLEDGLSCTLAGERARCSRVVVEGEAPMVLLVGVAWVEGRAVAATCRATAPFEDPEVCGRVVTLP